MKLLVTGGAGFIGSNFIRFWFQHHKRDTIVNVDALTYAGCLESLDDVARDFSDRYTFIRADIADYPRMLDVIKSNLPDVIVNFAAESHNSRAVLDPAVFVRTNVLGTQSLLEAARSAGVGRFHQISTCEVYGDLALDSSEVFTESSPYHPKTPYNASKASADHLVRAYHVTFGLPTTISVCCNNYGPYQFPEKLIPHFTIRGLHGRSLTLYEHSTNRREWIHVLDHCRAVERILLDGRVGESYNVGTGYETDIEAIAAHVMAELKLPRSLKQYVPDRPGHDRRYLLDSTKLRTELSWEPDILFDQGMRDTIRWYQHNRRWWEPLLQRLAVNEESWK